MGGPVQHSGKGVASGKGGKGDQSGKDGQSGKGGEDNERRSGRLAGNKPQYDAMAEGEHSKRTPAKKGTPIALTPPRGTAAEAAASGMRRQSRPSVAPAKKR